MATSASKFSHGYEGKKKVRPKKEVSGPYRSQSSVPSIRSKATKHEHRKVVVKKKSTPTPADVGLTVPDISRAPSRAAQRRDAQARAAVRRALTPVKQHIFVPPQTIRNQATLTAKRPSKGSWKPPPALQLVVERDVIRPLQDQGALPKHKTLGQDIVQKIAEWGPTVLTAGPEAKAAMESAKVALAGATSEAASIGGSKLLSRLIKPVQVTSTEGKAALAARAEQKASQSALKRIATKATGITGKADRAVVRQATGTATRREAAAAAGAPLKATKAGAAQTLPLVRGHEAALNPTDGSLGKTLKTTARALPGFVTVPIGIATHAGITVGRAASEGLHTAGVPGFKGYSGSEILAPIKYEGKAQLAFASEVAKVVTAQDSSEVQKAVEDELGLLLPITIGLGAKAGLDHLGRGDKSAAEAIVSKVRTSAEKWRTKLQHTKVGNKLDLAPHGEGARVFEKAGQAKEAAKAGHTAQGRIRSETADRTRGIFDAHRSGRHGRPSEQLRPKVGTDVNGHRGHVEVQPTDATRFLVANGVDITAAPKLVEAEIQRLSRRLEETREALKMPGRMHPDEKGDVPDAQDILDALQRHPEWLQRQDLRGTVKAARAQEREARTTPGMSPAHSEGARYQTMAINQGIPTATERVPLELRDKFGGAKTWDEALAWADREYSAGKLPIDQATKDLQIARSGVRQAKATRDRLHGEAARRVAKARKRAVGAPLQTDVPLRGKEEAALARSTQEYNVARDRVKTAATEVGRMRARRRKELFALRKEAQKGVKGSHPSQKRQNPDLESEMINEVQEVIDKNPALTQPEWTSERHYKEQPGRIVNASINPRFPAGVKHRTGMAARTGRTAETLHDYVQNSIQRTVAQKHIFETVKAGADHVQYREGDKYLFTSDEGKALFNDPKSHLNRTNHVLLPEQLTKRVDDYAQHGENRKTIEQKSGEAWISEMLEDLLPEAQDKILRGEGPKGRKYRIVPKAWADQMFGEMQKAGKAGQIFTKLNRMSTGLMLYTSPAWALTQIGAEYAQAALAEPRLLNPAKVRQYIRDYHAMSPEKRRAFESWVGVTQRALDDPNQPGLSMATASEAISAMDQTTLGRVLRSVPRTLKNLDQWKGGKIRVLLVAAKMDRDLNNHLSGFLRGAGNLYRVQGEIARELKGKPMKDVMEYWASHPAGARRYQTYLDDMLGNWGALTHNEQMAARMVIFYPFMRMSLKWTFYSFPKEHPIRAAASYWLGQQNANELHELLGGDPRFFGEWANVPLHLGPGKPTTYLPLSRLAVAGNAGVEALGGSLGDPTKGPPLATLGLSVAQPAAATLVRLSTGINKFTGKQEPNSLTGAVNEALSIPAAVRVGNRLTEELTGTKAAEGEIKLFGKKERYDALDKLFAALRGNPTTSAIRSLGLPELPASVDLAHDTVQLSRILRTIEETGTDAHDKQKEELLKAGKSGYDAAKAGKKLWHRYDKANKELDQLFRKYKIPHKAEDRHYERFTDEYDEASRKPTEKQKLEQELGLEPAPSKAQLERELGLEPLPSKEQIEKELGLR